MSQKNLWGELPITDEIRTPTQILKEQAAFLENMTKGVLQGDVTVRRSHNNFELELTIVAPAIDNYRYVVVSASHNLGMYPVSVVPGWDKYNTKQRVECANETEFESALETLLSSDQIRRVVTLLLSQSRAM